MKIIITESQYNRIWLLRRYKLVKDSFDESIDDVNPCRFKTFEKYESFFHEVFMNILHPVYYLIDDFDYDGIMSELKDMFYVELTEHYYESKEKCL
jgi:hypothetical protein